MLTRAQEKLIKSLHDKKGRRAEGLCLVEGDKACSEVEDFLEFTFNATDTDDFKSLVTTETPQVIAGVARIPEWTAEQVFASPLIVLLDHVQDPGNVGSFFRLALGFDATLILRESADPFSPKVLRSSASAVFRVPHINVNTVDAQRILNELNRPIFRFEKVSGAVPFRPNGEPAVLIFGNEGQGILGEYAGQSVYIEHSEKLESLNVGNAAAIALSAEYQARQK